MESFTVELLLEELINLYLISSRGVVMGQMTAYLFKRSILPGRSF